MYCGHARMCVCLSAAVPPHYCTDPDVTWGHGRGCPLVVHYWADLQSGHGVRCHGNNVNPSYKLASIPRHDDIVRTAAGRGLRALLAANWRVTGAVLKIARLIREVGGAGSPVIGRRLGGVLNITAAAWTAGFL